MQPMCVPCLTLPLPMCSHAADSFREASLTCNEREAASGCHNTQPCLLHATTMNDGHVSFERKKVRALLVGLHGARAVEGRAEVFLSARSVIDH